MIFDIKESSLMVGNKGTGRCLFRENASVWYGSPQRDVKACGGLICIHSKSINLQLLLKF